MKKRKGTILVILIAIALGIIFLAPVVHQNMVFPGPSPGISKPVVIYSLYKPLGCVAFGLGFTFVARAVQGFQHQAFYLSCDPPLGMPF
jgi:hypothetical protein